VKFSGGAKTLDRATFCFHLYPSSYYSEAFRKTYKASNLEVGGQSGSAICSIKVTPEVDYEAVLTFDGIPGGVTKAQLLSFPFAGKTVA
jgi:hypothetical protein